MALLRNMSVIVIKKITKKTIACTKQKSIIMSTVILITINESLNSICPTFPGGQITHLLDLLKGRAVKIHRHGDEDAIWHEEVKADLTIRFDLCRHIRHLYHHHGERVLISPPTKKKKQLAQFFFMSTDQI